MHKHLPYTLNAIYPHIPSYASVRIMARERGKDSKETADRQKRWPTRHKLLAADSEHGKEINGWSTTVADQVIGEQGIPLAYETA